MDKLHRLKKQIAATRLAAKRWGIRPATSQATGIYLVNPELLRTNRQKAQFTPGADSPSGNCTRRASSYYGEQ